MAQVELHIVLQADAKVNISGPINNKLLCYGLLEAARDAIKEFNDRQPAPGAIVVAPADALAKRG